MRVEGVTGSGGLGKDTPGDAVSCGEGKEGFVVVAVAAAAAAANQ